MVVIRNRVYMFILTKCYNIRCLSFIVNSGYTIIQCTVGLSVIYFSGIMAILFCGIVMSHYTHPNLSPVTQITTQQTFRTIAFIAGIENLSTQSL